MAFYVRAAGRTNCRSRRLFGAFVSRLAEFSWWEGRGHVLRMFARALACHCAGLYRDMACDSLFNALFVAGSTDGVCDCTDGIIHFRWIVFGHSLFLFVRLSMGQTSDKYRTIADGHGNKNWADDMTQAAQTLSLPF